MKNNSQSSTARSDAQLVAAAKQDHRKFAAVYKKYAGRVFNYFWYRVGHDREVAEDLMQETFLRAYTHLPKFRQRGYAYLTYLLSIARNVLVSHFRKRRPVVALNERLTIPVEITSNIEKRLEAEALWRAVQELSMPERDAILLCYQAAMPIKEIARVMAKTPNAVKIILSRARQKLKRHPRLKYLARFAETAKQYTPPRFLQQKNI